jgi:hypothetical protein
MRPCSAIVARCWSRCVAVVTWNGRYPWWNDDRRFRVTLGNSIVDSLTVIRAICHHRRNVRIGTIDLIE